MGCGVEATADLTVVRWVMATMKIGIQAAPCGSLTERHEALLRVSQTLISRRCSEDLFNILALELREVVDFHFLSVGIYKPESHEYCTKTFGQPGFPIHPPELTQEGTFTSWVYQHQEALVIPSIDQEKRFPAAVGYLRQIGVRSLCILPLATANRSLGALSLGSEQANEYTQEEVGFLSVVANQVALALDAALSFEESQQAQRELQRNHTELQAERDRLELLLDV